MELNIPKTYQILLYVLVISVIFSYASSLLVSDKILTNMLLERYSKEQVEELLKKMETLKYFIPLIKTFFFFTSSLFITMCIKVGFYCLDIDKDFGQILQIITFCNLIFLVPEIINIFFSILNANVPINEKNSIPQFSIFSIIDKTGIDPIFMIPLDYLNLFELSFWILSTYLISKMIQYSFLKSLKIVSITYGLGLSLLIVIECYMMILNN